MFPVLPLSVFVYCGVLTYFNHYCISGCIFGLFPPFCLEATLCRQVNLPTRDTSQQQQQQTKPFKEPTMSSETHLKQQTGPIKYYKRQQPAGPVHKNIIRSREFQTEATKNQPGLKLPGNQKQEVSELQQNSQPAATENGWIPILINKLQNKTNVKL